MAGLFDCGGGGGGGMCCWGGMTCCFGGDCGFCSECVCTASCNPVLCSNCITGDMFCGAVCTPKPGSGVAICNPDGPQCQYLCCQGCWPCSPNACGSTDQAVLGCALFAGTDENGNEIYQLDDGSLVYGDGSVATQADIACNEGACSGTPCAPGSGSSPKGGNSGRGMAPSSGGGGGLGGGGKPSGPPPSRSKTNCQQSKLTQAMGKLGSTLTSLLSGGKRVVTASALPGQKVTATPLGLSPNTFGLVVIIIGGLLLWMAFGHKPVAD